MQMTFRWFGKDKDTVTLEQIKQIPGVTGIVPALHYLPAGEVWPLEDVTAMRDEIAAAGFTMECIESVNVHEDIKIGLPSRDKYIDNYIESIRNLAKVGVKVITLCLFSTGQEPTLPWIWATAPRAFLMTAHR